MTTHLTELQQSFAAWHMASPKKRYTNTSLREQAIKCLSHHTYREVSTAIGMAINTIRSWQKSLCAEPKTIEGNPSTFIPINFNLAQNTSEIKEGPLILQINLPNGMSIKVDSTDTASIVAFIVALNKGIKPCSI